MTRPGPALKLLRAFAFAAVALISEFSIARADIQIAIEAARQRMIVSVDGTARWTWPVSTGAPGYRTPTGSYHVQRLARYHVSKEWDDAPMPLHLFYQQGACNPRHRSHAIVGPAGFARVRPPQLSQCREAVSVGGEPGTQHNHRHRELNVAKDAVKRRSSLFGPLPSSHRRDGAPC